MANGWVRLRCVCQKLKVETKRQIESGFRLLSIDSSIIIYGVYLNGSAKLWDVFACGEESPCYGSSRES